MDIQPIADLEAAGLSELRGKYDEYADGATALQNEFNMAHAEYQKALARYEIVFEKTELFEETMSIALGETPGGKLADLVDGTTVAVLDTGVGVGAVVSVGLLIRKIHKMRKAAKAARAATTAGHLDDIASIRKWQVASGMFTVLTSGASLALRIHSRNQRIAYYKENIPLFQSWYQETGTNISLLKSATTEMNAAVDQLIADLGLTDFDELEALLNGALQQAGEFQALIITASRMFCATTPLSAQAAHDFTGLPLALLQRRRSQIQLDPTICTALPPVTT